MNIEKLREEIQSLNKLIGKRPVGLYIHPAIRDDQPVHWVVEVDENRNEWLVAEHDSLAEAEARLRMETAK